METAELIRKWRNIAGLTQTDLAIKAGVSLSNVQNAESLTKTVSRQTLRKLSEGLGRSLADLDRAVSPEAPETPETPELDQNVIGAVRELPAVVEWPELNVAASHFVNIEQVGELIGDSRAAEALRNGRFRVRIRGTCMEPTWLDGDLVEFEFVRNDFVEGGDYYIESNDGATFKRCTFHNENIIVIACRDDPKKQWRIKRRDIRRAARALHALVKRD